MLSSSGFRRRVILRPEELRQVAVPTLVVWGERDPLGGGPVAQAVTQLIPHARLEVLPTGHAPWLGQPARTAATVMDFVAVTRSTPEPPVHCGFTMPKH